MLEVMHMTKTFATEEYITAAEIKTVRKRLGLSQKDFAILVGSSKPTIERWESSDNHITGPIVLLCQMLMREPEYVKDIQIKEKEYPLRMWYMHDRAYCTEIQVDDMNRKVKIYNYVDNVVYRAFGVIEKPTYADYEEFLETRCFPSTRDKMKYVLEDLGLPFYDTLMIIEKTEGRMAEDHFWIKLDQ